MKVNRQELLKALKAIKPGLATKDIVEKATCFIFTGTEIITYNDLISIGIPFKTDFKCSVPAQEFYKILSEMEDKDLRIFVKDGKLNFKTSRATGHASISTESADDIVQLLIPKNKQKWQPLPKDFIQGVSLCMFSTSKDMTHPHLSCLCIQGDEIISSDDYRISLFTMKNKIKNKMLIPATEIQELIKFKVTHYSINEPWVHFKDKNGVVFCARTIQADFPNYKKFLDVKGTRRFKIPEGTIKAIKLSSIFAEGDFDSNKRILITIGDGELVCKGEKESGGIEVKTKIDFKGKPVSFTINPFFFSQILSHISTVVLSKNTLLFKSGSFKHLISLFEDTK